MTPNPIHKVLFSMLRNGVKHLLMGGQACILYGAAEFSRDTDLAILADAENLARLHKALSELKAKVIAVPPFELKYLNMGLAVHFRCHHPEAKNQRIDVMSRMRGVAQFSELWSRRTTVQLDDVAVEILALPDLVQAKKTQRDKDWPMIARLIEAHYFQNSDNCSPEQISFWLHELRTPELLIEVCKRFPDRANELSKERSLLTLAGAGDAERIQAALKAEEEHERALDRAYWFPLRKELEFLRAQARRAM